MSKPQIGPVFSGGRPPGWRVYIEGLVTTDLHLAWSIDPTSAMGMTRQRADDVANSLRAFLYTLMRPSG